jgi:serine/threonine protein kinase
MSPVADSDLKAFYNLAANDSACLKILSSFYGCLASALTYLHNKQIRHRDIKPENILVKGDKVYLTDFGISLDWESLSGSTTTDDSGKTWLYCAPEVAYYQRRNSSSDIWSLGCVFLEMTTVLAGLKIGDLQSYFREKNGNYRFYTNIDMIPGWVEKLRSSSTLEDATLLEWAMEMLQLDAAQRPTAAALYQSVGAMERFCGSCCEIEASSDGTVSDGEFWADAIENEDNVAPNCPTNPPAQNLVTPIDTQAGNPNTEERLPNSSPKPKELEFGRDSNGVIVTVTTE